MLSLPVLTQETKTKNGHFVLCVHIYTYYIHGNETTNFNLALRCRWYCKHRFI